MKQLLIILISLALFIPASPARMVTAEKGLVDMLPKNPEASSRRFPKPGELLEIKEVKKIADAFLKREFGKEISPEIYAVYLVNREFDNGLFWYWEIQYIYLFPPELTDEWRLVVNVSLKGKILSKVVKLPKRKNDE